MDMFNSYFDIRGYHDISSVVALYQITTFFLAIPGEPFAFAKQFTEKLTVHVPRTFLPVSHPSCIATEAGKPEATVR